jgi:hypothetical protein
LQGIVADICDALERLVAVADGARRFPVDAAPVVTEDE